MTPRQELNGFIAKFTPDIAAQARAALQTMRTRCKGALELVYDNYNALAIGFSPTEKAGDVIFSIALYPSWVSLFIFGGQRLDDPDKLLQGKGKTVRHIKLESAKTLDKPAVKKLMTQALKLARKPLDPKQKHRIIIKSVSEKQRPRRPK